MIDCFYYHLYPLYHDYCSSLHWYLLLTILGCPFYSYVTYQMHFSVYMIIRGKIFHRHIIQKIIRVLHYFVPLICKVPSSNNILSSFVELLFLYYCLLILVLFITFLFSIIHVYSQLWVLSHTINFFMAFHLTCFTIFKEQVV